jgi:hypothetical protein
VVQELPSATIEDASRSYDEWIRRLSAVRNTCSAVMRKLMNKEYKRFTHFYSGFDFFARLCCSSVYLFSRLSAFDFNLSTYYKSILSKYVSTSKKINLPLADSCRDNLKLNQMPLRCPLRKKYQLLWLIGFLFLHIRITFR